MAAQVHSGACPGQRHRPETALWKGLRWYCLVFAALGLFFAGGIFFEVSAVREIAVPGTDEPGNTPLSLESVRQSRLSLKIAGRLRVRGKDLPQSSVVLSDGKTAYVLPTKITQLEFERDKIHFDDAHSTVQLFQSRALKAFLPKGTFAVLLRYREGRAEKFFDTGHAVTL